MMAGLSTKPQTTGEESKKPEEEKKVETQEERVARILGAARAVVEKVDDSLNKTENTLAKATDAMVGAKGAMTRVDKRIEQIGAIIDSAASGATGHIP